MMAIELSNICFRYPGQPDKPVLDIPCWSLSTGEQVFIHGPSGSGKSTLLGVLSGLFVPDEGQVRVLGQCLEQMTSRQRDRFRAEHIGYVFQQFNLIPYLSALDNLNLAARFCKQRQSAAILNDNRALLDALNIAETDWYRPVLTLSIGQQQRVAIARALVNKPSLLIADEPTSSLDAANRDAFMHLLLSMVNDAGMTLVFVSHDLALSSRFRQVTSFTDINRNGVFE